MINSQETYNSIVEGLEKNRERKLNKQYNSILSPFANFNKYFPGLERGKYIICTASSGIGKTKFSKYFFVINSYRFCKKFNIPLKIRYFALEETKDRFWLGFIVTQLYLKKGIKTDVMTLTSIGDKIVSKELLEAIKEIEIEITDMMNYIDVVDNISNAFGIYKYVRKIAEENGTYLETETGKIYIPNNPEEYNLVITDHISLLSPEKDPETGDKMSSWQAIEKYSKDYCLKGFCKRWNYTVINIQQQESSKEKQEYTFKGVSIEDKLEPSLDGLSTNKETQREADLVIGVFAPDRYKIENFRGYDITKLKDSYRAIKILKDRHYGLANSYIHLFFDGSIDYFSELPSYKEINYNQYSKQ